LGSISGASAPVNRGSDPGQAQIAGDGVGRKETRVGETDSGRTVIVRGAQLQAADGYLDGAP